MTDYCSQTDVFLGCGELDLPEPEGIAASWHFIKAEAGNTSPSAFLPFSRLSCGAYSGGYTAGYGHNAPASCGRPRRLFEGERFVAMSHLHHSGTGNIRMFYNYMLISPFYGETAGAFNPRGFSGECGRPGYYACTTEDGIRAEVTVTPRVALHRYTFGKGGGRIAVDCSNDGLDRATGLFGFASASELRLISERELAGMTVMRGVKLYFRITVSGAVRSALTYDGRELTSRSLTQGEVRERFGAVFDLGSGAAYVTVALTTAGDERTEEDVRNAPDFDVAAADAYSIWNRALGTIHIETSDDRLRRIFYSNLYHSLVKPSDWSGDSPLGFEGDCVLDLCTLWDQYKTQLPLVMTFFPEMRRKLMNTFISFSEKTGVLPHTLLLASPEVSLGIEAVQARGLAEYVIADAYYRSEGQDGFDRLLRAAERDIFRPAYRDFGEDGDCARATHLLDMAEVCRSLSEVAGELGENALAKRLHERAGLWTRAFDADGMLRADSEYYEGNRWNYSFRLMHDMPQRIALCGGADRFAAALDRFFGFDSPRDVSRRFEGFNNETDMETPYAYLFCGRRDRMARVLRDGARYMYSEGRGGLPGNNDSGGMSSCFVWNSVGLFPVSGQDLMLAGAPLFERAELRLPDAVFLVERRGDGVSRVTLDGVTVNEPGISVRRMMRGGRLVIGG